MEFNKALVIGVGVNDTRNLPSSKHICTDVILISQATNDSHPLLYQLKKEVAQSDDLLAIPEHSVPNDAFAVIGNVTIEENDKKKKRILLRDKNDLSQEITVTYKHLIIVSNTRPGISGEEEFTAALQALIEALKVRKNIAEALKQPSTSERQHSQSARELLKKLLAKSQKKGQTPIDHIAHDNLPQDETGNTGVLLPDKRLYEVQL